MGALRIKKITRRETVKLTVNGQQITAYRGESVLAALMASGHRTLRNSPVMKGHRGALCGMGVCFECLVNIDGVANRRACMVEVDDGMEIVIDDQ